MPEEPHNTNTNEPNERLEAYLDGLLSPEERQSFELELADDPQLRRDCELQREIDASLTRTFVAPAPPSNILAIAEREASTGESVQLADRNQEEQKKRRRIIVAVLAASVAWLVVGLKMYQSSTDDGYQQVALADIYEQCVDSGFRPKWVCDDDREFAETFQRRQGVPLLLKDEARDVMVGLSYLKGISAQTTTMLARVEGEPILVFVDTQKRDAKLENPSWLSGLKLFRLELGELVLYEVSPFSEARVLNSFYIPDSDTPLLSTPDQDKSEDREKLEKTP